MDRGFDIGEKALRDGLTRLSNVGLISVEYGPGRAPFVTVKEVWIDPAAGPYTYCDTPSADQGVQALLLGESVV